MARNRLQHYRHVLEFRFNKEYAEFLGVTESQLSLWTKHKSEPELDTLIRLWKQIKTRIPDVNLQDLIENDDL